MELIFGRADALRLYRHLLRDVKTYPSKKRAEMDACIRSGRTASEAHGVEFRKNRGLTDVRMQNHHFESGRRVLRELGRFKGYQEQSYLHVNE